MWRPLIARKRSEASLLSLKAATSSNDNLARSASPSPRRSTLTSRSTLTEVLKNNSFRSSNKDVVQETEPQPVDPVILLNQDLIHIATVYPDVQVDVLRELLLRFDGESRLQVCVEQLFRYKSEWARGRLVNPPRDTDVDLPAEELFRSQAYIDACKRTLYNEFKALNKSAVDAVLAEVNNDYAKARPILQEIAAKTWRATLTSFFRKKRSNEGPPSFLLGRDKMGVQVLLSSGNTGLDAELQNLFMLATRSESAVVQQQTDYELADKLNYEQAAEVGALFECQCCFDDVPFERITTCVTEGHVVCVECVRRTFNEALFGQSWTKSINNSLATLQCFAPLASRQCGSHVTQDYLRFAVTSNKSGHETWTKFEQRLATDSLTKSSLPLQSCPFCSYAEIRNVHTLQSASDIRWRLRTTKSMIVPLVGIFIIFFQVLLPALLFVLFLVTMSSSIFSSRLFRQSLINISHQHQTLKFKCRSPTCGKKSCTVCHKQWHDPHVCNEPLILSLRNTVEAARTAALKRVCPRCGMGFVKSSGCNKLVCVCGYAMCYLCRKNIGKVSPSSAEAVAGGGGGGGAMPLNWNLNIGLMGRNQAEVAEEADIIAAGEGYRHFCPHFRPLPGQKCTECDKCDLYKTEDEDAIVRRAGEIAEREWRAKYERDMLSQTGQDKVVGLKGLENALVGMDDKDHNYSRYLSKRVERRLWRFMFDIQRGQFDVQGVVDWVVERVVVVERERS